MRRNCNDVRIYDIILLTTKLIMFSKQRRMLYIHMYCVAYTYTHTYTKHFYTKGSMFIDVVLFILFFIHKKVVATWTDLMPYS